MPKNRNAYPVFLVRLVDFAGGQDPQLPQLIWARQRSHVLLLIYLMIKDMAELDHAAMLAVALAEARKGLAEGGIPIGAAIFDAEGRLVGSGYNRRVQDGDPSMHGETDAFRNAGRQR